MGEIKEFRTAERRGHPVVPNAVDVEFAFDDHMMTAHPPTSGQLALFLAQQGDHRGGLGVGTVRAMFDLLAAVLDQHDYDVIEAALREGVEIQVVIEIIEYLVSEWAVRPAEPPPNRTARRARGARRSTADLRAAGE